MAGGRTRGAENHGWKRGSRSMHFRLRHRDQDVALPRGVFIIGRGEAAQLVLDDPLVSRRHARLTITDASVTLLDLGSQNGVFVNGERLRNIRPLQVGDRILLGEQELLLLGSADSGRHVRARNQETLSPPSTSAEAPPPSRARPVEADPRLEIERAALAPSRLPFACEESTQTRSLLEILDDMTRKALAAGQPAEAERLLDAHLGRLLASRLPDSKAAPPAAELTADAAAIALRVADATGHARWIDWVLDRYQEADRPPPASVLTPLEGLCHRIRDFDANRLRELAQGLQRRAERLAPEDRLQLVKLIELVGALRSPRRTL